MHTRVMRYAVQHVLDSAAMAFTDTNERGTRERHEREARERGKRERHRRYQRRGSNPRSRACEARVLTTRRHWHASPIHTISHSKHANTHLYAPYAAYSLSLRIPPYCQLLTALVLTKYLYWLILHLQATNLLFSHALWTTSSLRVDKTLLQSLLILWMTLATCQHRLDASA